MANTNVVTRTNYFRVTDEEKWKKLFERVIGAEDTVHDFSKTVGDVQYHGFGCYSSLLFSPNGEYPDEVDEGYFLNWAKELQTILPENDAFIMMDAISEKLRYAGGSVTVVTKEHIESTDTFSVAFEIAEKYLGKDFRTQLDY